MQKNKIPLVSVIIVNYNGQKWLKNCFSSLKKQTYKNLEIIMVDNNSTDNSIKFTKKYFPEIKIIENKKNLGFAGGNNLGLRHSKGEYLILLNNDTIVPKDYVQNFLEAFKKNPNLGCAQSKLININSKKIDSVGAYWTNSSFLYYYGINKNSSLKKYNIPLPFFSIKGASMITKKSIINQTGLFDEDFWCYYEETDFCHRLWLLGYECWYWPSAICYHANGGTSESFDNSYIQFHNFKNKLMSIIKNFSSSRLLYIIPVYFLVSFGIAFIKLFSNYKISIAILKSFYWNIENLSKNISKRQSIQKKRKISDKKIMKITKKNPKLFYYLCLFNGQFEKYEDK